MIDQKLSTLFSIKEGIYDCSEFIYRNSALFLMVDMDKAIAELEQLFGVKARITVNQLVTFTWILRLQFKCFSKIAS